MEIGTKKEIDLLIKHADIISYKKAQRIRWIWQVARMDKERTVKRMAVWRTVLERRIGRRMFRCENGVREDVRRKKNQN